MRDLTSVRGEKSSMMRTCEPCEASTKDIWEEVILVTDLHFSETSSSFSSWLPITSPRILTE